VVSHLAGDEGYEYARRLRDLAEDEGVRLVFFGDRIREERQLDEDGRKIYTLQDLYCHADLVTFPSIYEGFGNALLEAIYYRRPLVVNRYPVFARDIEPKGFMMAVMDGFVDRQVVVETRRILEDAAYREMMVEHNYKIATRYYGYTVLRESLRKLILNIEKGTF